MKSKDYLSIPLLENFDSSYFIESVISFLPSIWHRIRRCRIISLAVYIYHSAIPFFGYLLEFLLVLVWHESNLCIILTFYYWLEKVHNPGLIKLHERWRDLKKKKKEISLEAYTGQITIKPLPRCNASALDNTPKTWLCFFGTKFLKRNCCSISIFPTVANTDHLLPSCIKIVYIDSIVLKGKNGFCFFFLPIIFVVEWLICM